MGESFEGKEFAVTGATGFLGGYVVPAILKRGGLVRIVVRGAAPAVKEGVTVVQAKLDDHAGLVEAFRGCYGVFHLAGLVVHSRSHGGEGEMSLGKRVFGRVLELKNVLAFAIFFYVWSFLRSMENECRGYFECDARCSRSQV